MSKILAYCDSPTAPTGFGRSAQQVLGALHARGHEITQLAVNYDPGAGPVPWRLIAPDNRDGDPYGLANVGRLVASGERFDFFWTTFDPQIPWAYVVPGLEPKMDVLRAILSLRKHPGGMRAAGWFPVDGGPLSEYEMAVLGADGIFDRVVTMSSHVHDLALWTMELRGATPNERLRAEIERRIEVIPHGVDAKLYSPVSAAEKRRAKREYLGVPEDTFVILQLERNQQRKEVWLAYEVMERYFRVNPDMRGKVVLYQHMWDDEENHGSRVGWNLKEIAWRYGLEVGRDVRFPGGIVRDEHMGPVVYGCADAFLSVSTGEGFQYPAWEALSCGVPIVVPNDSARAAWFPKAPGAQLYATQERSNVMRGGYHRRMNRALPEAARAALAKLIRGKVDVDPGRMHEWVQNRASVEKVQTAWLALVDEELAKLQSARRADRIAIGEPPADLVVGFRANPGLGDILMFAPALRAWRLANPGKHLRVAPPPMHLDFCRMFDLADSYDVSGAPLANLGFTAVDLSEMWAPASGQPDPRWWTEHRSRLVAEKLGLDPAGLAPSILNLPPGSVEAVARRFEENFGVRLDNCVVLALGSGSAHRALPAEYIAPLCARLRLRGLTPVLVGTKKIGFRHAGVVDISGETDLPGLLAVLAGCAVVVATDSGPMHMAAALGKPLVACFPTNDPRTRLGLYTGQMVVLSNERDGAFPGEVPAEPPGYWSRFMTPARITAAVEHLALGAAGPEAEISVGQPAKETK